MFNVNMVGAVSVATDNEGRIIMPKFSGCEIGESLSIIQKLGVLRFVKTGDIKAGLQSLLNTLNALEEHEDQIKATHDYINYVTSIVVESVLDSELKFNSNGELLPNHLYNLIGVGDSIVIQDADRYVLPKER